MFTKGKGSASANEVNCTNESDFKKLYDATFQQLFKVSFRVVNDQEVAEDLVHDSYIKANEKEMIFPSMDDAKFWLIRVVKNASLNYVQRKAREAKAYHKVLYETRQTVDGGEVDLLKSETIRTAKEALDKLPENLKEVLVLKEYADMSYKEIGQVLGISEGNVKVRVFRARERLCKYLGEEDVFMP